MAVTVVKYHADVALDMIERAATAFNTVNYDEAANILNDMQYHLQYISDNCEQYLNEMERIKNQVIEALPLLTKRSIPE